MRFFLTRIIPHVLLLASWSAIVIGGMLLLDRGTRQTFYFVATQDMTAEAHQGRLLILLGSAVLLLAACVALWMRSPIWACILVAVPAVVVGGLTFFAEGTLLGPLSLYVMLPVAFSALISVFIFARPMPSDPAKMEGVTVPKSPTRPVLTAVLLGSTLTVITAAVLAYNIWTIITA